MGEDLPAAFRPPCIDAGDAALAAEPLGDLGHHLRPGDGGAVDRHLVRPRQQQRARILGGADAAAHGQWHEAHRRRPPHHVEDGAAILVAGGDVEEAEFVRPRRVIGARLLHGVAGVAQLDEVHALDDAAGGDVETGDDAGADGHAAAATLSAAARSSRPS